MDELRLVLVDDHLLVRQGLTSLLHALQGIRVIGEAESAEAGIQIVGELAPDVVVMDVSMKGMSGIDAIEPMKTRHPGVKVVMLTMHDEEDYVTRALQAGAAAYLIKGAGMVEFELALRAVARGQTYLSPAVSRHVVAGFVRLTSGIESPLAALTPRQRQILQAIAEGHSTKEIAFRLQVSTKTVETHRSQLMERLDIHDIAGLVRFAIRHRLVRVDI